MRRPDGSPRGRSPYRAVLDLPTSPGEPRRQVQKSFATLSAARAWVAGTRDELAHDDFLRPDTITLRQIAERWLTAREREVGAGSIRTVSVEGYRSALSGALLHLGDRPVQQITTADVRGLLTTLATEGGVRGRPLGHRSVVYALTSLRLVLGFAVEAGTIKANPAERVKAPKPKLTADADVKPDITTWGAAELRAFRQHLAALSGDVRALEPWLDAAFRLTLAGMRRSEVLGLSWRHVDLDAGVVFIKASRVKTGRRKDTQRSGAKAANSVRALPVDKMVPGTIAALKALFLAQGRPSPDVLVVRDALGEPVHPDAYSTRFDRLVATAELPHLTSIHHVRHSIARTLHEDGIPPIVGASWLGHSLPTHLANYLPTSDSYIAKSQDRIEALFADVAV